MSSSLRPDQDLVNRTVDEAALHRVAVLERDVRILRQQLVQITDQLLYSRQKLDLLAQELISRNVVSAVPNGSTNSNAAAAAVDHMMAGGNMVFASVTIVSNFQVVYLFFLRVGSIFSLGWSRCRSYVYRRLSRPPDSSGFRRQYHEVVFDAQLTEPSRRTYSALHAAGVEASARRGQAHYQGGRAVL